MEHRGLNQMLCAAIVSTEFRDRLIHHTEQAIIDGYLDFNFQLTKPEKEFMKSIHVKSLEEFAEKIYFWINHLSTDGNIDPQYEITDQQLEIEIPSQLVVRDHQSLNSFQ